MLSYIAAALAKAAAIALVMGSAEVLIRVVREVRRRLAEPPASPHPYDWRGT